MRVCAFESAGDRDARAFGAVDAADDEHPRPFRIAGMYHDDRAPFVERPSSDVDRQALPRRRGRTSADRDDGDAAGEDKPPVPRELHHPFKYTGVDRRGP